MNSQLTRMKIDKECPNCNNIFVSETRERRKFCSQTCSAIYNNRNRNRNRSEKIKCKCINCFIEIFPKRSKQKYCSIKCSGEDVSKKAYQKFLNKESINPRVAKPYILKEQNCKCSICKVQNEWNNKILIFVLDHIDGNSENNNIDNLRLVCPNCDSQLDTFKSKNRGKGRY